MNKKELPDKVQTEIAGGFLDEMAKYTDKTWTKWDSDKKDEELIYCGLALCGEAGELANLLKKYYRAKYLTEGHKDPEALSKVPFELADVLYYMLRICKVLNIDLEKAFYDKMEQNIKRYA